MGAAAYMASITRMSGKQIQPEKVGEHTDVTQAQDAVGTPREWRTLERQAHNLLRKVD